MTAAKATSVAEEFVADADVTESPAGWQWDTVVEGAPIRIIFDTIGDNFIGMKLGKEHIDQEPNAKGEDMSFDMYLFRGRDGERYALNASYALDEAMQKVDDGVWCRITYVKDVETAKSKTGAQSAMKDFKVDVRK